MTQNDSTALERCGNCEHFSPMFPDDETAAEGKCKIENWKGPIYVYGKAGEMVGVTWGYHPNVLRRDGCSQFTLKTELQVQS